MQLELALFEITHNAILPRDLRWLLFEPHEARLVAEEIEVMARRVEDERRRGGRYELAE